MAEKVSELKSQELLKVEVEHQSELRIMLLIALCFRRCLEINMSPNLRNRNHVGGAAARWHTGPRV
jgi:hypothetical protein